MFIKVFVDELHGALIQIWISILYFAVKARASRVFYEKVGRTWFSDGSIHVYSSKMDKL